MNKNFQEIKLFITDCSFKPLAPNTIVRLQIVRFFETLQTGFFLIPELTKVLFLYIFHWIALHLLLHYLPFKNFAACCCFFITCALNKAETAWMKFVFSCLFTALYSH